MMKEPAKVEPSIRKQEKCEFCNDVFWNLGTHQKACPERKEFMEELDKKGILTRSNGFKEDTIWVSGGLKIVLSLRGKLSTENYLKKELKLRNPQKENIRLIKNLLAYENKHDIRIEYDGDKDELDMTLKN